MPISETWIDVAAADGGRFKAFVALPEGGTGPGLLLLQEIFGINFHLKDMARNFAEEGYVVAVPDLFWRIEPGIDLGYSEADFATALKLYEKFDIDAAIRDAGATLTALKALPACTGPAGAIGYCLGGRLAYLTAARADGVACAISYYGVGIEQNLTEGANIACPLVIHCPGDDSYIPPASVVQIREAFAKRPEVEVYVYPGADHGFDNKNRPAYNRSAASLAYSRTIAVMRKTLGPHYDLDALWDRHLMCEFADRAVDKTMATMVAEPYVNVVPTLTGGTGFTALSRFYRDHFLQQNPADTKTVPISRTIGADRLVDEFLFCFTHDIVMDWMLPGIKPTGKYVEVPFIAIVNFRGGKLCNEHIYWDQASVLAQLGMLDEKGMPVVGRGQAKKLLDETLPANEKIPGWRATAAE
jgi:carboxymethylenebutenolidase